MNFHLSKPKAPAMNLEGNAFRRTALALAAVLSVLAGCATPEPSVVPMPPTPEAVQTEYRIGPGTSSTSSCGTTPSCRSACRSARTGSCPAARREREGRGQDPEPARQGPRGRHGRIRARTKVNVIVTGFQGSLEDRIRVVGAATKPQALPYRAGMTLVDVMVAVGGLSEFAAGTVR